jgi:hypothetical protein
MFINKNNKINTMKLLIPLLAPNISKLILMVLLTFILAISFALVTNHNAFASQVMDTPIATYTYPDNWEIIEIVGNGESISFQPVNEPRVFVHKTVYLDSSAVFGQIVYDFLQMHEAEGYMISMRENAPGSVLFDRSHSFNGMSKVGYMWITQIPNSNHILVTDYTAEPSKASYYSDPYGFYVNIKSSPQVPNMSPLNDQASQMEMEMRNDLYKSNMKSWENFGDSFVDDDDNSWVD